MVEFRVGISRDFLREDGELAMGDMGLELLEREPGVSYAFLPSYSNEVTPEQIAGFDGIISLKPRYTADTFAGSDGRLAVLARFGVGYDNVDVPVLTANDCVLAITPDGVRRPMASSIVAFILALAHEIPVRERLVREGRWSEGMRVIGAGLRDRTLGSIGIGNIGAELFRLIAPFGMRLIAYDPFADPAVAASLGVELVELETLFRESDFLCVNCPLSEKTRGLVGTAELALMKPTSYLINTARGPIVDQRSLTAALREHRIRAAALDVFEQEPIAPDDPLLSLENVILTSHTVGYTDELVMGNGVAAIRAVLAVARGEVPSHIVNRDVLERPTFQSKLARFKAAGAGAAS